MSDNVNFEKIIKTEKRKKWLKTIAVSGAATVIIGGSVFYAVYNQLGIQMAKQASKQQRQFNIDDLIYSPNIISTSQYYSTTKTIQGTLKSDREKNIDGYHVAYPEKKVTFNTHGIESASAQTLNIYNKNPATKEIIATNRQSQQKEPLFFNVKYEHAYQSEKDKKELLASSIPTHEAETLSQLSNTLGEVAITFDKRYSYDDIRQMIPDNVMINYYWLGIHSDKLDTMSAAGSYIGLNASDDGTGKLTEGKAEKNEFLGYQGLKSALKQQSGQQTVNNVDIAKDGQKQMSKNLKTAKFAGVIVTGRTQNLAKLDNQKYTFATNVGVTTPIMPYQEPIK
ncbi:anti sigma factor C-terminal domain-containing protein [uncultured Leuconostoc sp.]|uniref:anti sigma factor C-terminal domain-containing protein n=1 Tax=uncultured Leuconostoc sp. TaxID=173262 RepID=UPI0025D1B5EB|nr:anti sigma factor C-terminal domain-containing protein [uncultured Leuconostoc sp.]